MLNKALSIFLLRRPAYYISIAYVLFGILWIIYSELILAYLISDPSLRTQFSIFGGIVIVIVTSLFLYFFIRLSMIELQKREHYVKVSRSNLKAILDSAIQGYILLDLPDAKILDFNKLVNEYWLEKLDTRLKKGELLLAFLPDQLKDSFLENFNRAVNGKVLKIVKRFKDKNDKWIYYEIIYQPVIDEKREVISVCLSVSDITEQTISNEKLRKSESLYRLLAENSTDAIVRMDQKAVINFVSPAIIEITGFEMEAFIGKNIYQFIKEENIDKVIDYFNSLKNNDSQGYLEVELLTANGESVWVEASARKILDSEIPGYEIITVLRDISERKKAELELSMQKYALDHSSIVSITDPNGIITYVNNKFCEILGYTSDQLIGNTHRIIKSDYHDQLYFKKMWSTIKNGEIWKGVMKNKTKSGDYFWADTTIVPFLDENKKPYKFLAIRFDITEQKEVEQAMRLLNLTLEKRVKQRTEELEEANLELESFTSAVSHDLRNPINLIRSFTQLLLKKYGADFEDKPKEYLTEIVKETDKMSTLIKDLLELSKITRKEIIVEEVDLSEEVRKIMKFYQNMYADKKYLIRMQENIIVKGDARLLKIALDNLINNAFKYSYNKENPRIVFGKKIIEGKPTLYVQDNGAGFNMEFAHRIFEPFERLHAQEDFKGTGIGLATVARIISKHEGEIWAKGEKNVGSTFYFYLPGLEGFGATNRTLRSNTENLSQNKEHNEEY
ncbi:MAG: PAS domain S-box protein [Chitinophagaceae bacterium]|nr:MAG: PAS domain S-box protein [Chitinophagaceae bacterium]